MDQNRDAHPPATRIGIVGYGNLGRGVEAAIAKNPDMAIAGIFTPLNQFFLTIV